MSSYGEPEEPPNLGQQSSSQEENRPQNLGDWQKKLADLLRPVANDAPLMDDSAEDAHQIVKDIYSFIGGKVFIADQLDPGRYEDSRRLFETARQEEDDTYYVYVGILERHRDRRQRDLPAAEAGADLKVVAEWRRKYIHKVQEFHTQVVTIEGYLSGPVAPP
jgi:hypothetical protein